MQIVIISEHLFFISEFGLVLAEIIVSTDSPVEYRQVSVRTHSSSQNTERLIETHLS